MLAFLSHNICIARDRAWDQTVASRGKGPDLWQPYVEEWENPPSVSLNSKINQFVNRRFGPFVVKRGTFSDVGGDMISCKFETDSSSLSYTDLPICRHCHLRLN